MTTKEIVQYIKDHKPWTVNKEWKLIKKLGGATQWGDDYYVTYSYEVASDKIDDAMKELAKETDQQELRKKMKSLEM